jgi:hypothetical protein
MGNHINVSMRAFTGRASRRGARPIFCEPPKGAQDVGDLDPCFDTCHNVAMLLYLGGDEDGASDFFDECMDELCGE